MNPIVILGSGLVIDAPEYGGSPVSAKFPIAWGPKNLPD